MNRKMIRELHIKSLFCFFISGGVTYGTVSIEPCQITHVSYEQDIWGNDQYTFLSDCKRPCIFLENHDEGARFFWPGARLSSKIKKIIKDRQEDVNDSMGYFFEILQEQKPFQGVRILFGINNIKRFLISRTFNSVSGQTGLLIRCIARDVIKKMYDKSPSKIRRCT